MKIMVVAPYQRFADIFRDVFETHSETVHPEHETPEEFSLELVVDYNQDRIGRMTPDCDVLIARGFSAELLKRRFSPVVEIPILPYDIIRCIIQTKELFGNRRIVFAATRNMTLHIDVLARLLDLDVEIIYMPSTMGNEPEKALAKITSPDSVVVGGMPVCALADRFGYPNVMIESGPEAMYSALSEAKRIAHVRKREQEKAQSFNAILDYNADGILAVDRRGCITSINATAETILGVGRNDALGRAFGALFPAAPLAALIGSARECRDEVVRHAGQPLVVNMTGIHLNGQRIGCVVTLQYVAKIQSSEKAIRAKVMERGLVARHSFADIRGKSPAIVQAVRTAEKFSRVDASVLIVGKSGTGKELFAQSLHNASARRKNPFVAINCAAISESLLESELFGYEPGAFTGANRDGKPGLAELAHTGTLFLDEISEMPLRLQGRLLRVLQEKEIMRLGGDKVTHVDIRVVAATNKDLFALVESNAFREDLYYRLTVLVLNLPSLEERSKDIPELLAFFLANFGNGRTPISMTNEAIAFLSRQPWRGNIRELGNACEQLAVLSENGTITLDDVKQFMAEKSRTAAVLKKQSQPGEQTPELTAALLSELLEQGLSRREIATRCQMDRTTLWRRMRDWGMLQK